MSNVPFSESATLDKNFAEFSELLDVAETSRDRGDLQSAAAYAQAAAQHAWLNPNGLFSSERLEVLLGDLGSRVRGDPGGSDRPGNPAAVLHVVTQAYQTGGSTQFVACWVDEDLGRHHRICVTQQGFVEMPDKILTRTAEPGSLIRIDRVRGGLLDRALALRALAMTSDVVLLNVHPHDVIPSLAFSGQQGLPPVIYVNHADHVFWVGTKVSQTVLNMRLSGAQLAAERRGIEPSRSNLTCRPLRPLGRTMSRAEAKRAFDVPESDFLVVTAADGTKYRSIGGPSLLEMILPVFRQNPRLRLLAAGPRSEGEWADAEAETGGRIKALGPLPDVSALHQAADIYLDSFPFASLTSLLEAGNVGTPSITYRGHPESCAVLGADTHGLDQHMVRPSDPVQLRADLVELADNAEKRTGLGDAIQRAIVQTHTGPGWRAEVDRLYRHAATTSPTPEPVAVERRSELVDHLITLVMARTGFSSGTNGVLTEQLVHLPLRERLSVARRLSAAGNRPGVRKLLPTWMVLPALSARRRIRALRRP